MFKGLGNLGNLGSMLKQAQQMGSRLKSLNDELKTKHTTGSAGGGMIEVEANGVGEVLSVRIDPALFAKADREMIEDLLPAAFNQCQAKVKQLHSEAMQSMTAGLDLPGMTEALANLTGELPPEPPASTDSAAGR